MVNFSLNIYVGGRWGEGVKEGRGREGGEGDGGRGEGGRGARCVVKCSRTIPEKVCGKLLTQHLCRDGGEARGRRWESR